MILLIDGKNLVYRAFYGMPELTRKSDGFPTGAIFGWMKSLWRLMDEYPGTPMEVFWDAGSRERNELSAEYKANRKPIPEPMKQQLPLIERFTTLLGITSWKEMGSEADDLIGARALELAAAGEEVLIVSADKDFAQLVNDRINLLQPPATVSPKNEWRRMDAGAVIEKFGVAPDQIADYLALMGDSADNVKGIEGVGPKTASDWLRSYKTLEGLFDNSGRLSPKRFQNIIYENKELLLKNRQLTTLKKVAMGEEIKVAGAKDAAALIQQLLELEMTSSAQEAKTRAGL